MPPLVVPQGVVVRLIWSLSGAPYAINVLGARNAGAIAVNQALANTVGSAIKSAFTSSTMNAQVGSAVSLANVGLRDVSQANRPEFTDSGAAVPGTDSAGGLLPLQTALVVTLRTGLAGRSYRGRVYLPGFTETGNSSVGTALSGVSTVAVNFVTAISSALTASGLTLAIMSRKLLTTEPVTGIVVRDLTWDTVRKRSTPGV